MITYNNTIITHYIEYIYTRFVYVLVTFLNSNIISHFQANTAEGAKTKDIQLRCM